MEAQVVGLLFVSAICVQQIIDIIYYKIVLALYLDIYTCQYNVKEDENYYQHCVTT